MEKGTVFFKKEQSMMCRKKCFLALLLCLLLGGACPSLGSDSDSKNDNDSDSHSPSAGGSCLTAQEGMGAKVVFYNVENLFDCRHDSLRDDYEFLPEGRRRWTPWRMQEKVRHIAQVMTAIGTDVAPMLVGLAEVENDSVMTLLTEHSLLRGAGYRYVMSDGDDPRGRDIALMYRPSLFHLLGTRACAVPVREVRAEAHARPILYAWGELTNGDTLHVVVCHWPSRLEGRRRTEPLRQRAADVVTGLVDSIRTVRPQAYIVVMGDFNETPEGEAVQSLPLENVTRSLGGTYRYRGRWEQLDQLLVSPSLLDETSSVHVAAEGAQVFSEPFVLEREPLYGGFRPRRTYQGPRYRGGYSDHLPVYVRVEISW